MCFTTNQLVYHLLIHFISKYIKYGNHSMNLQNVLSALTDITKYPEWRVSVCEVTQISVTKPQLASSESTSESKVKNPADITGVQYDVIRIKKTCFQSNILEYWISVLKSWKSSRRKDRSSCYDVNR